MSKIKWGCIQPLTGGMYIGARNAIGHDAEWIISYEGLTTPKFDKDGNIIDAGNEYHLLQWFKKHNIEVPYYTFGHKMFDNPSEVKLSGNPDYSDIDIVVAVPVCAGLSSATIASADTKKTRNCNMEFIAEYTLGTIKPKAYIFENAPALYASVAGQPVRDELESMAAKYGYSITYYKTDTRYHNNCQKRPRTFVIFTKTDKCPVFGYEHNMINVESYLSLIPENATQQETIKMADENQIYLDFFRSKLGTNWREKSHRWPLNTIIDNALWVDIYDFINNCDGTEKAKEKLTHHLNHIQEKLAADKNYYSMLPAIGTKDYMCACMFKNVPILLHYNEDRLYTIREWLWAMGMPHDFEMYGDINMTYSKIGQNVPVSTAQWIVSETLRGINNTDFTDDNVSFVDNTKAKS